MTPTGFEAFRDSLTNLATITPRQDKEALSSAREIIEEVRRLGILDKRLLSRFIHDHPYALPLLASAGGLGQEQLKNQLKARFHSSGWIRLATANSDELVSFLDHEYDLVNQLNREITKDWSYSDVLVERLLWSKKHGASSVGRGRKVEDEIESLIRRIGVPYVMRTRFTGRGNNTAPCDCAIPAGNEHAEIVIGMKGFNSTGSKLTDAVVEIEKMANVRLPTQFVYAVVDGIGWLSRQADLRRIYKLWEEKQIDGVYTLSQMDQLEKELQEAVRIKRIGLIESLDSSIDSN